MHLDLPGVVRQKRFESDEVVAFDDQVAAARIANRSLRHVAQQMKWHGVVMIPHRLFSHPI